MCNIPKKTADLIILAPRHQLRALLRQALHHRSPPIAKATVSLAVKMSAMKVSWAHAVHVLAAATSLRRDAVDPTLWGDIMQACTDQWGRALVRAHMTDWSSLKRL